MSRILVVGAGLSGAVLARSLAEKEHRLTIIDENSHIGGMCRTYRDGETGIMVHQYGPHIFHTDRKEIWDHLNSFTEFVPFTNRVKARTDLGIYSLPINLLTLCQFFGKQFSPAEAYRFVLSKADTSITKPRNLEEQALSMMGEELYRAFFHGYTIKQWGRDPKELPPSILKRLPFRFSFDDNYFSHQWQGMPKEGYSVLIDSIIEHPHIKVELNRAFSRDDIQNYDHVFYSGQIDRFFDYKYGRLEYRTLDFEKFYPLLEETYNGDFQGGAVVNDCRRNVPYTRITEHKHFAPWEEHTGSVCYREYSRSCELEDIPFYPVILSQRNELLERYRKMAENETDITFIGRLGLYQYLDMDESVRIALDTAKRFVM